MMRPILVAVLTALLSFVWVAPVSANGIYKGYYYGASSPQEIATLVERSLAIDPTGRTMLDAAKCRRDGSCAAPINYVESFQARYPRDGVTLQTLVAYLRRLVIRCNFVGEYQMDRIIYRSGSLGRTDVNGMSRAFLRQECAWTNPDTGLPVLAQNCANPVGQRVDLHCVIVNVEVTDPRENALIWARYRREDDECFAYRKVTTLYEPDSPTAVWTPVQNGCIGRPCDFTDVNRALGATQQAQGELMIDEPGTYQIRLSPDELLVLCSKLLDRGIVRSSFAVGVRWQQDYQLIQGQWHARVYHESAQAAADGITLNQPRGLAFWASNRQAEAEMRGLARTTR